MGSLCLAEVLGSVCSSLTLTCSVLDTQAEGFAMLDTHNITVTEIVPNGASAPLVRIGGGVPFWLGGFHVDRDLRRRVSCWRPVWVGGICQASPGAQP